MVTYVQISINIGQIDKMLTKELNTEVWVISDTHLIADRIHDNRQAFSRMQKTSQGKDLYYQETVLKAFRKMAQ